MSILRKNIDENSAAKTSLKEKLGITNLENQVGSLASTDLTDSSDLTRSTEFNAVESRVDNLEENQYSGVVVYSTYAELPATGTLLVSYKVSNDSTASNNGFYHWNGSAYVKDASLANGIIEEGNVDAVSGGIVYNNISKIIDKNFIQNTGDESGGMYQTGLTFALSTQTRTFRIPVFEGQKVIYSGTLAANFYGVIGYSENDDSSFVQGFALSQVAGTEFDNYEIIIPEGVNFIRAQSRNLTYAGTTIVLDLKLIFDTVYNYQRYIELLNAVNPLKYVEQDETLSITGGGSVVRSDNGQLTTLISTNPDAARTDYVAVIPGETIYVDGWFGGSVGMAGYDESKTFNSRIVDTSTLGEYTIEYAADFEITIPAGVYFIRTSTKDHVNFPIRIYRKKTTIDVVKDNSEKIAVLEKEILPEVVIEPINSTSFYVKVLQKSLGKYVYHRFIKIFYEDEVEYGDSLTKTVVGSDIWYPDAVIVDGNEIAQGNYNFIYLLDSSVAGFEDESGHVGAGHGCIVQQYIKFFADGQEFDPETLSESIECSRFRFVLKANCLAINKPISPDGAHGIPKLTETGDTILAAVHFLDSTIESNNVLKHRNKLIIKRDNTRFVQCHGGMLSGYRPYFTDVIVNNDEITWNSHINNSGTIETTLEGGSLIDLNSDIYQRADEIKQFGDIYTINQRMTQYDNSRRNKTCAYFYFSALPDWLKVYQMPVITTQNASAFGEVAEIFSVGDVIEVDIERKIEIKE